MSQPRERQRTCENATLAEFLADRHKTINDRLCDRCLSRGTGPGFSSPACSLPDRHATGLDAPASLLPTSQGVPRG